MIVIEIFPHSLTSVYRILLSMLRKIIEVFVQLVSSAVNHSYHMPPFLLVTVILLSSKKGRGLWCLQVPNYNYPRRGRSNYWIILIILFPLVFLRSLWIINSLLYWNFSPLFFISGSPLSIFCVIRTCAAYSHPKKGSATNIIGVRSLEYLVGNNITNQSLNEICNDFLNWSFIYRIYLVLSVVLDVICLRATWFFIWAYIISPFL